MNLVRASWTAVVLTVLLGAAGAANAQTGTVTGSVTDSASVAVSGADVRIDGTTLHVLTDDAGRYTLANVPAGAHTVRVLQLGFRAATSAIMVEAGGTVNVDFHLERRVIELPGTELLVGSRARHTAADELAVPVDVFPQEQIQRQGTTETSQVLQSLAPSINFPHQSVTDATDVVRP